MWECMDLEVQCVILKVPIGAIYGTRGVVELPDKARGVAECFIRAMRPLS